MFEPTQKNLENPKISVCIPCYNRPLRAKEAIMSAWTQSIPPFEILVGDDSSDDATRNMVNNLISNGVAIKYQINNPSLGQSRNVQSLLERAQGDFVSLMHDDDRYRPGAFEALLAPFRQHSSIIATFGKQVIISEEGQEDWPSSESLNIAYSRTVDNRIQDAQNSKQYFVQDPLEAGAIGMFPNNGFLLRRHVANKIDYHAKGIASEACDWYFGFRVGQLGEPFCFINEYTCDYRISNISVLAQGYGDPGFHRFHLLLKAIDEGMPVTPKLESSLSVLAPVAIGASARFGKHLGWRWYFSRWHRKKIFTFGGMKRFLKLCGLPL